MKILIITSEFPPGPGGIGTHAKELAYHWHQLGHPTQVITPQDYRTDQQIADFNQSFPLPIHTVEGGSFRKRLWSHFQLFRKVYREFQPDLVLATNMKQVWLTAFLQKIYGFPFIAVGHGTEFGVTGRKASLNRAAYGRALELICVSRFTQERMLAQGIQPKATQVIYNGADQHRFNQVNPSKRESLREQFGIGQRPTLLTVGNVTPRKGQDNVIRALPHLTEKFPDILYLVAGLPSHREPFQKLAEQLGVADHVRFLGAVSDQDIVDLYNAADLKLMTSAITADGDMEGFGIAAIEAGLCGRASIVSGDSGLAEAVIDGETGLHVNPKDPIDVADKISQLLDDPDRRNLLGQNARQRALKDLTWEKCAEKHIQVFEAMLGKLSCVS